MYHNYNSLRESIHREIENQKSVLNKFPEQISRPITQSVSKYLAQFTSYQLPLAKSTNNESKSSDAELSYQQQLGQSSSQQNSLSSGNNNNSNNNNSSSGSSLDQSNNSGGSMIIQLETIEQVNWTLENLMYGLTLSHDYQDIIKDCWHVYHDWMTVLLDEPRAFVPQPIRDEPGLYAKRMLWHLYHLFVPRLSQSSSSSQQVVAPTKHIMMCHAVLVLIETIAKDSKLLTRELWEEFLKFFLAINDAVLAPPFNKTDDFGEALSSRIVATLFEIWLIACHKMFPSPSLWRTFQELCANWRHHISLVTEWNRVSYALTNRLLELTSAMTSSNNNANSSTSTTTNSATSTGGGGSSSEPPPSIPIVVSTQRAPAVSFNLSNTTNSDTNVAYDINGIIGQMSLETVMQSWFRFLHIVGRPVDFSDSLAISKQLEVATRLQQTRLATFGSWSTAGGSIDQMAVVAAAVAAQTNTSAAAQSQLISSFSCLKKLPVIFLEVMKGVSRIVDSFILIQPIQFSSHSSYYSSSASKTSTSALTSGPSIDQRIRSKSVYASSNSSTTTSTPPSVTSSSSSSDPVSASQMFRNINIYKANRPTVNSLLHLVGQWLFDSAARSITGPSSSSTDISHHREFVLGQAEAFGALCRIFCSVKTNETILPEYLSRFYALLIHGLRVPTNLGDMINTQMEYDTGEILASILVNGVNLFKVDLKGVNVLLIPMLNVLNAVFKLKYPQKEDPRSENKSKELLRTTFNIGSGSVSLVDLKKYCIHIFASLLSIPNHFGSLTLIDPTTSTTTTTTTQFHSLRSKILEIFLAAMTNEQDTSNFQMLFGCGKLIVGEWTLDELVISNNNNSSSGSVTNKKDRAIYCYNQIVTLICAPLRINHATLQNHLFALSIFDSLASIVSNQHLLPNDESQASDSVSKTAVSWIWHYVRMQIKRKSKEHTKEMHSVIVAAYNCLIMLLIAKPSLLRDKQYLQTVLNCIEIGISGSSSSASLDLASTTTNTTSGSNLKESNSLLTGASSVMSIAGSSNSSSSANSGGGSSGNSNNTGGGGSGAGGGSGGNSDLNSGSGNSGANNSGGGSSGSGHSSSTMLKSDKELKPASLRVKEAAECVLCFLMEHTSIPPSLTPSTPYSHLIGGKNVFFEEAIRQPLDEKSLIELTNRQTDNKFKYYALDGSLILGILERPLVKDSLVSSVCPTVTVLLRGPFGQQAWSMHLRPSPFAKLEQIQEVKFSTSVQSNDAVAAASQKYYSNRDTLKAVDPTKMMMMIDNDSSMNENGAGEESLSEFDQSGVQIERENGDQDDEGDDEFDNESEKSSLSSPFSDKHRTLKAASTTGGTNANRKPKCESSVPSLSKIARKYCKQLPTFQKIKDEQIEFENGAVEKAIRESGPSFAKLKASLKSDMALNLRNCQEFQSSRILLSTLGYCSIGESGRKDQETLPDLLSLEGSDSAGSLADHVAYLDKLPTRTFSACYIFYVKSGQTDIKSIMSNTSADVQLDKSFYLFIQSLGSIINSSSTMTFNASSTESSSDSKKKRLNSINGAENILLWSDVVSEIGFILPNSESKQETAVSQVDEKLKFKYQSLPSDLKVLIVWVERIQDVDSVPVEELVQETFSLDSTITNSVYKPKEIIVIFIHPLENKLNRILTWSNTNKKYCYTIPLIDGMVVSSRMLSSMIRQTVLNIFRRKRLEIDDYQPPHVKRKNKISEIIKKFMTKKNEPELFTSLLMGLRTESV